MSNKTNQSVLVNNTSSYYLKQYAALQFPGSVDNFGTKTPIHLLQQQEESEHSVSLRVACDSDYDLDGAQFLFEGATYDSVTDLVKDNLCLDDEESIQEYNEHPRFDPFIPYEELVDKKNADREDIRDIRDSHRLDTMADYVDMYSTASGYDTADDITVLLPRMKLWVWRSHIRLSSSMRSRLTIICSVSTVAMRRAEKAMAVKLATTIPS